MIDDAYISSNRERPIDRALLTLSKGLSITPLSSYLASPVTVLEFNIVSSSCLIFPNDKLNSRLNKTLTSDC